MCGGESNEANTAGVPWEDRVRQEFTDVFSKCENKLSFFNQFLSVRPVYVYKVHIAQCLYIHSVFVVVFLKGSSRLDL